MKRVQIKNVIIVNEGKKFLGSVVIEGEIIAEVLKDEDSPCKACDEVIDASGCYLLPGIIDDHVHFRDPGLTHKADIDSESRAAAAGGVTSVMDMPNTNPQTTSIEAWEEKMKNFSANSLVNYSCYFGATNTNYTDFKDLNKNRVCGIKLFMGSSTGNMLVDRMETLRQIFAEKNFVISAHCEDQNTIHDNTCRVLAEQNATDDVPLKFHPTIRSAEACYNSSRLAVELAQEYNTKLHILHISTADELGLLSNAPLTPAKRITSEACISHLMFEDNDYEHLGTRIKCNPAIKTANDKHALRHGVNDGKIDVIATDHAPHLLEEKEGGALKAVSGMPMIQFSLLNMLELVDLEVFKIQTVVEKMCHAPAIIFEVQGRGFIRPGYQADLVIVRPQTENPVTKDSLFSKCKWSPMEGHTFHWKVEKTIINGNTIYDNGKIISEVKGQELQFR